MFYRPSAPIPRTLGSLRLLVVFVSFCTHRSPVFKGEEGDMMGSEEFCGARSLAIW